jgi:hypothetical protein
MALPLSAPGPGTVLEEEPDVVSYVLALDAEGEEIDSGDPARTRSMVAMEHESCRRDLEETPA